MANISTTTSTGALLSSYVHLMVGTRNLGNTDLSDAKDPKVLKSFSIVRKAVMADKETGESSTAAFTAEFVLDSSKEWDLPKYLINYIKTNQGKRNPSVSFKYGHVNGVGSPLYLGTIAGLEFSDDLYTMTLEVVADGRDSSYSNYNQDTWDKVSKTAFKSVSEFVESLANLQGWDIGKIVPTKEFDSKPIVIDDVSKSPIEFIKDKIQGDWKQYCVSKNGESNYALSFNQTKHGTRLFFVPTSFNKNSYDYRQLKSFNYYINLTPNNGVISFRPRINSGLAEAGLATSHSLDNMFGVITKDTKQFQSLAYDFSKRSNKATLNPSEEIGGTFKSNPKLTPSYADMSRVAESVIKNNINDYSFASLAGTEATLSVIGDPELLTLDYINVIPMMESQGRESVMHPTGGTYMITQITDTISDQFITEMELVAGGQGMQYDLSDVASINRK